MTRETAGARHHIAPSSETARLRADVARAVAVIRAQQSSPAAQRLCQMLACGPLGDMVRQAWR